MNQRKGLGVLGFKDGVVYHGQFVNDAPSGLAVETYPNGFGESSRSTGGAGGREIGRGGGSERWRGKRCLSPIRAQASRTHPASSSLGLPLQSSLISNPQCVMPPSSFDVDQRTPCDIIAVYKGEFDDDNRHGLGIMQVCASSALYLLACILGFVTPRTSSPVTSAFCLFVCILSSLPPRLHAFLALCLLTCILSSRLPCPRLLLLQ